MGFCGQGVCCPQRRIDAAVVNEVLKPIFRNKEKTMIQGLFEKKYDEGIAIGEARGKPRR